MSYSTRRDKGDYRWVPECSGIYRLYHGDTIVYIGETGNLIARLQEHESDTAYWGTYDYEATRGVRKAQRKEMERRRIRREMPSRNIQNVP